MFPLRELYTSRWGKARTVPHLLRLLAGAKKGGEIMHTRLNLPVDICQRLMKDKEATIKVPQSCLIAVGDTVSFTAVNEDCTKPVTGHYIESLLYEVVSCAFYVTRNDKYYLIRVKEIPPENMPYYLN